MCMNKSTSDWTPLICCTCFWKAYINRISFGYAEGKTNCTDPEHAPIFVVTAIFYRRKKTPFISFFVYSRKSRDRFRTLDRLYSFYILLCVLIIKYPKLTWWKNSKEIYYATKIWFKLYKHISMIIFCLFV